MTASCVTAGSLGDPACWCFQGQSWVSREPYWGVSRRGPVLALPLANWVMVALHLSLAAWVSSLTKRR